MVERPVADWHERGQPIQLTYATGIGVERSNLWKRLLAFYAGAAVCVIIYLFLLNFPGLGPRGRTYGLVPVLALAATTWWLTASFLRLDGMSLYDLGLGAGDDRIAHLGIGLVAGSALTVTWILVVTLTTGATWQLNPAFRPIALVGASLFNFFNNVGEELAYRGYAFVRLAERFGTYVTALATSALFALLHLQAGLPWLSVVAGVFSSGLVFAALFARWRSLPLALGFHVATNIVQDASGLRTSAASLFVPDYSVSPAETAALTLGGIALINLVLAAAIFMTPARHKVAAA